MMRKLKPAILFLVTFTWVAFHSCSNDKVEISGNWEKASIEDFNDFPFRKIQFLDSVTLLYDENYVEYKFDKRIESSNIYFQNQFDSLVFPIRVFEDSILMGSTKFLQQDTFDKKHSFAINLFEIDGKLITPPSERFYRYSAVLDINQNDEVQIKIGDTFLSYHEFPIFFQSSHRKKSIEVLLVLDRSIEYIDLLDAYNWLSISGVNHVRVVTSAKEIGDYTGFSESIIIWNEDIAMFRQDKELPPLPPFPSRILYLKSYEPIAEIKEMNLNKMSSFQELIVQPDSSILVSFSHDIKIEEYIKTKIEIRKIIDLERDRISKEMFNSQFQNIELDNKLLVHRSMPNLIYDRK